MRLKKRMFPFDFVMVADVRRTRKVEKMKLKTARLSESVQ